jgi:hypothetical protein
VDRSSVLKTLAGSFGHPPTFIGQIRTAAGSLDRPSDLPLGTPARGQVCRFAASPASRLNPKQIGA